MVTSDRSQSMTQLIALSVNPPLRPVLFVRFAQLVSRNSSIWRLTYSCRQSCDDRQIYPVCVP
jgi:hypothetical protein